MISAAAGAVSTRNGMHKAQTLSPFRPILPPYFLTPSLSTMPCVLLLEPLVEVSSQSRVETVNPLDIFL